MKNATEMNKIASERNLLAHNAAEEMTCAMQERISQRKADLLAKIEKQIEDSARNGGNEMQFNFCPIDFVEFDGMDLTEEGDAIYGGILSELYSCNYTVEEFTAFDMWKLTIRW